MQRAKLWWVEGLLHHRLGNDWEAWRALDTARRSLMALNAASEIGAITADMARIAPLPRAVKNLCHEAGQLIPSYHPLFEPLQALRRANQPQIPAAAGALREAAASSAVCPPAA